MSSELVSALESVVGTAPGADAFVVDRRPPEVRKQGRAPAETVVEAAYPEMRAAFERSTEEVRDAWGEPDFLGSAEHWGFPAFSDALWLATWRRGGVTAYVALREDGRSLWLEGGALSEGEIVQLESWLPEPPAAGT